MALSYLQEKPGPEDTQGSIFSVTSFHSGAGELSNNSSGLSAEEIAEQQVRTGK